MLHHLLRLDCATNKGHTMTVRFVFLVGHDEAELKLAKKTFQLLHFVLWG
jgi:hypothetical protein